MNQPSEHLERLISRFLDDECTPIERRELRRTLGDDPAAAALYEEHAALDRELGHALRSALGRSIDVPGRRAVWPLLSRTVAVAAAACLVVLVWVAGPPAQWRDGASNAPGRAGPSWFAPPATATDALRTDAPRYDRPHIPLRQTACDWIVIPGERPGEFMVIEVKRVRTRAVGLYEDF